MYSGNKNEKKKKLKIPPYHSIPLKFIFSSSRDAILLVANRIVMRFPHIDIFWCSFNVIRRMKLTTPSIQCVQKHNFRLFNFISIECIKICCQQNVSHKLLLQYETNESLSLTQTHTEIRSKEMFKNGIEKL